MKITLKTGGLFARFLPAGTTGKIAELDVPDNATPLDVIAQIGAPTDGRCMIVVNGMAVPPSKHDCHVLSPGDKMSYMPPLKGG
jgi:sulfur carrier protein ThiS